MSISTAMASASSSLRVSQERLALVSRNIANASTPGYVRKQADIAPLVIAGQGQGVRVEGVQRLAQEGLARDSRVAISAAEALRTSSEALGIFTQTVGQPDEERSISSALAAFDRSLQRLGEMPEDETQQRAVIGEAQRLTESLQASHRAIEQSREAADAGIAESVTAVNRALQQLETVNREIAGRAQGGIGDFTALEDQRSMLLDDIAQHLDIQYFLRGNNEVVVLTGGGVTLLDSSARTLEFTPTAQIDASMQYPTSPAPQGIFVEGIDIAPGSGNPGAIRGGRLAGNFEIRDQVMPQFQVQIDEIASVLADQFQTADASFDPLNPAHAGLFTEADGTSRHVRNAPPHDPLLNPPPTGFAGRISVNQLVVPEAGGDPWRIRDGIHAAAPGNSGDAVQIRAFEGVFDAVAPFSGDAGLAPDARLGDFATDAMNAQQFRRVESERALGAQTALADSIELARTRAEGVNIDEELQKMILIEQTYGATAQVIQAASQMLDILTRLR